jgi:5'-deoxynucleotidase YfbR-like HD superfamily hydrolase
MGFAAILPYLIPVLQVLWELLKPTIRKLIEKLWEKVENEIEGQLGDLTETPAPKLAAQNKKVAAKKVADKVSMFNTEARKIYAANGKTISDADLNLVRELVHNKMTRKKRHKQGKSR